MRSKKSSFQKFGLQIPIKVQSEMKCGKTMTIVYDVRFCEGLCHDLEKSGQATKGKIELIKVSKGAIRKLHTHIYIATDYGLDGPGSNSGGDEIFNLSRSVLGTTQPPVKWLPGPSRE